MTDHVGAEIREFLEGRLAGERVREIELHLDQCSDCAADVAFARRLRAQALAQGFRHISTDRILALATHPTPTTPEEQAHLDACASCRDEIEWARSEPGATALPIHSGSQSSVDGHKKTGGSILSMRRIGVLAAAVLAIVAVFVFMPGRGDEKARLAVAMAHIEPLPVQITRGAPSDAADAARLSGLQAYKSGDYTSATANFRRSIEIDPNNDEVMLYLASAELLVGRVHDGALHLRQLADRTDDDVLRDECLWQLAHAELSLGHPDAAARALEGVVAGAGTHADDARSLLEKLSR